MGYNPADKAAVENEAKSMDKKKLEEYYVQDKNRRHLCVGDTIMIIIGICFIVFFIGVLGYTIGMEKISTNIELISDAVADEVCPISSDIYIEVDLKGIVSDLEIDCLNYRHR